MKLAGIDFLIIAAYMAVVVYIALRSRKFAGKNLENYFLGGRGMPGWMAGISYAASMMGADAAVAYGGLAAITGAYVCWFYLSRFGIALFLGAVLFAVFWKRLNTFTTLEFYELRFEGLPASLMRCWLAVRTSLIAMVAWTGISLLALVKIAAPITGWNKTEIVLLALPLAVGYVYLSGYLGVVLTNLVQIGVLATGALILAFKTLMAVGGPEQLSARLATLRPGALSIFPPNSDAVFPAFACVAWLLGTSIGYGGDAAPMGGAVEGQRVLSTRSPREACVMYLVAEITLFTLVWLVSVPCLAVPILWPHFQSGHIDRELAYGMLMKTYLGPGLLGLVFVSMLGGIISVVGDNLNFGSQVLLNDIYRRYLVRNASTRHYFIAGKLSVLVILSLALLVVYKVTFLFDVAIFMVGLSATEMPANWAQWWWWRFNGWGRVTASLAGGLVYVLIRLIWPGVAWWNRMFIAMLASVLLCLVVTLCTAPERRELLEGFYRRAKPLGNWSPFAGDSSTNWRVIVKGIGIALAGAAGVMAYICGISLLYLGRYAPGVALLVAMGLLSFLFLKYFGPFVQSLLSGEERASVEDLEQEAPRVLDTYGFSELLAVVAFATAIVLGVDGLLFVRGFGRLWSLAAGLAAVAAGAWFRRRSKGVNL